MILSRKDTRIGRQRITLRHHGILQLTTTGTEMQNTNTMGREHVGEVWWDLQQSNGYGTNRDTQEYKTNNGDKCSRI